MTDDPLIIAGTELRSRLLLGSGGFHPARPLRGARSRRAARRS